MDLFSCHTVTLPHEDEETNSRVREATSAWRQSSDAAVVHDRETRRVRSRRCAIHSRIHRWCRTMGGVFLRPTPAKARRAVPEDTSTFPRVLPPRPSRVRERFHGDIIVSLSFCAFARDAWTVTEMGAGNNPSPGRRENHPLACGNRESSAPRASRGERPHRAHRFASTACVCRSTSVRRHASIDSNHPIEESQSSRPARRAFLRIPSHRHRRSTRARSPSVASFRGLSVRPVRPFRPHRRRWSSPFLVSSSPRFLLLLLLPSPRFRVPGALVVATSRFSFVRLGGRGARFYEL